MKPNKVPINLDIHGEPGCGKHTLAMHVLARLRLDGFGCDINDDDWRNGKMHLKVTFPEKAGKK